VTEPGPEQRRTIDVYPDEVQPGDLVRDKGRDRTVTSLSGVNYDRDSIRLHLDPCEGLPPFLPVPRDVKVTVKRLSHRVL
jgi:hypothetical protein